MLAASLIRIALFSNYRIHIATDGVAGKIHAAEASSIKPPMRLADDQVEIATAMNGFPEEAELSQAPKLARDGGRQFPAQEESTEGSPRS
ncbi:MAG: hypothetical protein IPK44_07255 [Candidatus Accumulibacter sp.]|jgi:hypothetical protein|uniref:hypothetical protein n=1 Tax=Accumulibacter sp. TaxID=2053492 RepID=UPI002087A0C0|nr:hypothetical protein [Accumulibacter sp.]MBK8114336.1 hypothetical protein [Accumulibacter sp.]MBK8579688.1 hypothetical protein [Candidatus Accumulibacter propinquus]